MLALLLPVAFAQDLAPADPGNAPRLGIGHALGGSPGSGASLTTVVRVRLTPRLALEPSGGISWNQGDATLTDDDLEDQTYAVSWTDRTWEVGSDVRVTVAEARGVTFAGIARANRAGTTGTISSESTEDEDTPKPTTEDARVTSGGLGIGAELPLAQHFSVGLDLVGSLASHTTSTVRDEEARTVQESVVSGFGFAPTARIVVIFWP